MFSATFLPLFAMHFCQERTSICMLKVPQKVMLLILLCLQYQVLVVWQQKLNLLIDNLYNYFHFDKFSD